MKIIIQILFLIVLMGLQSCNFLLGSKKDTTVDEVFEQGKIDPALVPQNVGYVPIFPFFSGFQHPVDIYVGYDNMIYVCDDNGLHILDLTGKEHRRIAINGATDVIQDRKMQTYVCGRAEVIRSGQTYNLAAVYKIINSATSSGYIIVDTLLHPDCDLSRSGFRGALDEQVSFTGLAATADNTLYISRTGPLNELDKAYRTDNCILFFDPNGNNIGSATGLNPISGGLKSCAGISSMASFCAPPQLIFGMNSSRDFLVTLNNQGINLEYRVLWIREIIDTDNGNSYLQNDQMLNFDTTKANDFLYRPFRFSSPTDIFIAPDKSGYIFVVDDVSDSLYQFTQAGFEGVNAPANSTSRKQIIASFGGNGNGPFQFDQPSGVCFFKRMLYVADKGNNRICRFKLNTDIE